VSERCFSAEAGQLIFHMSLFGTHGCAQLTDIIFKQLNFEIRNYIGKNVEN
jgi:hypothetical protein